MQISLPGSALAGRETFANDLAVDVNSAIVIAVADVLKQVRHLGKRASLAVFGQALLVS